jgi:thiosulfate/3-mercaptopyruvate sulfurtransferase
LVTAFACGATASADSGPLLVDAGWLSQHLNDKDLIVLHVGKAAYNAGHVPGARAISEDDVSLPHDMDRGDLMLELPPAETLRARFAALGIGDNSTIVVYAGKDVPLQSATRIVFTLDYLRLGDQTMLLNGGFAAWQAAGNAVTSDAPKIMPGTLHNRQAKPVVVDAAFVQGLSGRAHYRLIDARAPVFYKGDEPTFGKRGHIPGAINIPFSDVSDARGLIDRDRLARVFAAAGVTPGDTVVAYCHVGQQATAVIFAARLLGYSTMLYDGAFQDWATRNRGATEP